MAASISTSADDDYVSLGGDSGLGLVPSSDTAAPAPPPRSETVETMKADAAQMVRMKSVEETLPQLSPTTLPPCADEDLLFDRLNICGETCGLVARCRSLRSMLSCCIQSDREGTSSAGDCSASAVLLNAQAVLDAVGSRDQLVRREKLAAIRFALSSDPPNESLLRQLAISPGGLLCDELRRAVWPLLLRCNPRPPVQDGTDSVDALRWRSSLPRWIRAEPSEEALSRHRDHSQVLLDVRRTLARFPTNMAAAQRNALQRRLTALCVRLLARHRSCHYYQGFHDICLTLLLVVGLERALQIGDRLLPMPYFREYFKSSMDDTSKQISLIFPIIAEVDPDLERYLTVEVDVGIMFALSWLITWFAHDIDDFRLVVRMYDLFLATHPLMPIYVCASLVLNHSTELLACGPAADMPIVHSTLQRITRRAWTAEALETIIADATDLFLRFPPSRMEDKLKSRYTKLQRKRWRISLNSTTALAANTRPRLNLSFWAWTLTAVAWHMYQQYAPGALTWR